MDKPFFTHDCERCQFLGSFQNHDLYFCPGSFPTVIARFGSDGPDYVSGVSFALGNPYLNEALIRSVEKNLFTK